MYKIFENESDWKNFRKGMFTASQIYRLLTEPTKKEKLEGEVLSKGAKTYIDECICDMIAEPEPDFYNAAMQRGNEVEPQAVRRFAELNNLDINDNDFIYTSIGGFVFFTDNYETYGGTPDIILKDAIVEIKCPNRVTHLQYKRFKSAQDVKDNVENYYAQMQLNMYLTEKSICYFMSFDDRFKKFEHQHHIVEVPRDDEYILLILDKIFEASKLKFLLINNL